MKKSILLLPLLALFTLGTKAQKTISNAPVAIEAPSSFQNASYLESTTCNDNALANPDNDKLLYHWATQGYVQFFDIEAKNSIFLKDIKLSSGSTSPIYDIYSIAGGWSGNTGSTAGWTYEGAFTINFNNSFIGLNMNYLLNPGEKRGFMIIPQAGTFSTTIFTGPDTVNFHSSNAITATNADLIWHGAEAGDPVTLQAYTGGTHNSFGEICYSTCLGTASFQLYGLNKLWANAGANDANIFYHGVTQSKNIRVNPTGGVGPYTYVWSNSEGYTMKNQSGNQIQLFEPQSSSWAICEITDQGTGCITKDSVFIELSDEFYCGTASNQWQLKMCENNVSVCMSWNQAKAALKAGTATLGDCNRTPINIVNPDFEIVYKAGTTVLAPLFPNNSYTSGSTPLNNLGPTVTFADNSTGNQFDVAGWNWTSTMGVTNVNTKYTPQRNMVAHTNGAGFGGGTAEKTMTQVLAESVQTGAFYELSCDFGQRSDNGRPTLPPVLRLHAGGTLLTPIAVQEPSLIKGDWVTWRHTYFVSDPLITGALKVEIGLGANTNGQQLNLDHVTLGKTNPAPIVVLKTNIETPQQIIVYPNPTKGFVQVQFYADESKNAELQVMDINGRILFTKPLQHGQNNNIADLDLSSFANGLYFIRMVSDQGVQTEKIQLMK